jgi:uncharacterized membrane protein YhaH (DUF805 family)
LAALVIGIWNEQKEIAMETTSPYNPPQTELLGDQEEVYGTIKVLSASGRIGRLRYIAYTIGIPFLVLLVMGLLMGVAGMALAEEQIGILTIVIFGLGYLAMFVINIMLTIQRCHDFDVTGWLSLILLIPLAPLVFWLIPGTEGANRFGPQPPPNKGVLLIVIVLLVLLIVVSIIAAIAIPAYQEYVARAAAAGM